MEYYVGIVFTLTTKQDINDARVIANKIAKEICVYKKDYDITDAFVDTIEEAE